MDKGMYGKIKIAAAVLVALLILVAAFSEYVALTRGHQVHRVIYLTNPRISIHPINQDNLFYDNGSYVLPYALLGYNLKNVTQLYVNDTIFSRQIPRSIYILNASNDCYQCGFVSSTTDLIRSDIARYGVVQNASDVSILPISNLTDLPDNSILIVLNGVMPAEMFSRMNATSFPPVASSPNSTTLPNTTTSAAANATVARNYTNTTVIGYLLDKGTSIIYVGRNFSHMLLQGSIITDTPNMPSYLKTCYKCVNSLQTNLTNGFYFDSPTFTFFSRGISITPTSVRKTMYGDITYASISNGSVVAFSNYLTSWGSPKQAASDIAKAVSELFWLPRYSSGNVTVIPSNAFEISSRVGIVLNSPPLSYAANVPGNLNSGFGRITAYTNDSYDINTSYSIYDYSYYTTDAVFNGTISMPSIVVPGQQTPITSDIFTNSQTPVAIEPHLGIYSTNMTLITLIPMPYVYAKGNFTFIKNIPFGLGPGNYIAILDSFTNFTYSATAFHIGAINILPVVKDFKNGNFSFYISSSNSSVSGINYAITMNKLYKQTGTISNGTIVYDLPPGTPISSGTVPFSIEMLSHNYTVNVVNPIPPFFTPQNRQIIEVAVVALITLLITTLVKSPNTDEFYIDIPSFAEQKKVEISVKEDELISVFDKLNSHFHWKYMPLSKNEYRIGVSNNVHHDNIPVNITSNNVDFILNQMAEKGDVVVVDSLYAPAAWVQQSGHDIEYLAIFKKLRIYLVMNTYLFTDLDTSSQADIVATLQGERIYIVIYSKTSKFVNLPIYPNSRTFLAFLNYYSMASFLDNLYKSHTTEAEILRLYIEAGQVRLVDSDNPHEVLR